MNISKMLSRLPSLKALGDCGRIEGLLKTIGGTEIMGAAKRRKELGIMPEPTQKPRKTARFKADQTNYTMGMGSVMALMTSLMLRGRSGATFAMRSEMARMNRELDRPSGHQSTESA